MKRLIPITVVCLSVGIVSSLIIAVSAEQSVIPSWLKNTAKWWAEGKVGDSDFINALQWLMDNGILKTPKALSLEQQLQEKMLESMLKDKGAAPPIGIGFKCTSVFNSDPSKPGTLEFIVEVMNHDNVSHSPVVEIQNTDDYKRIIKSSIINIGKLVPTESKTVKGSVEDSLLGGFCNAVVKEIN